MQKKRGVEEAAWDLDQGRAILSLGIQETRGTLRETPGGEYAGGAVSLEARLRWRGRPAPGSGGRCPCLHQECDPGWQGLLMVCLPERRAPARRGRGKPCQVETARLG